MSPFDWLVSLIVKLKYRPVARMLKTPLACQKKIFFALIDVGKETQFGRDHNFREIKNYEDFKKNVPLNTYDNLVPYIEKMKKGTKNVLWKGKPIYIGKTSGTSGKTKYIPVTRESLKNQLVAPGYSGFNYSFIHKKYSFLKGNILFFSDGHFFEDIGGIKAAPISTIANSRVPFMYKWKCLPSDEINSISDFEERIEAMISVSVTKDIRAIVGMPVWILVFLRRLKEKTGKEFKEHFPNFKVLFLSGMDYEPFMPEIGKYIQMPFDLLETYPSTEGFIAYQDRLKERGMQLVLNEGIFFEFVALDESGKLDGIRITLKEVEVGKHYAMVLNTNAGLWAYLNGDTVRFVSIFPHRIVITGRISQYISGFGEHVILEEVEKALAETTKAFKATIVDFSVAPNINSDGTIPFHEWFIEFGSKPNNLTEFAAQLDHNICNRNFSYLDLVERKAIAPLKIVEVPTGGFEKYLQLTGKKSLQQKIPHLSNDDKFVKQLKTVIYT